MVMTMNRSKTEKILEGCERWVAYYRKRIDRFIEDFYGIKLKLFQKIVLLMMNSRDMSVFIGSRGLSKTYLTALFASAKCILYPGITVVTASKTRKQGQLILGKIKDIFMVDSPLFKNEVEDIRMNQYDSEIIFKNGSKIFVASFNENSRGYRAQVIVIDEFRLVDPALVSSVFRKFLTARRHIGAQDKELYAEYETEPCQEVYLSSAWYKSSWAYDLLKSTATNMISGATNCFACCLPYQIAIKEKLLARDRVAIDLADNTTNEITWTHEMLSLFWSGTDGALYQYDTIEPTRQIKWVFYPKSEIEKINDKRVQIPPKLTGEKRILSADIALMSSSKRKNDATSIFINQMLPIGNGKYIKNIVYTENNEGLRTDTQALNIRRLFEEFDCDYLVIDGKSFGLSIIDLLMADMYNPNTGDTYDALSCCNNDEIAKRCCVHNAKKVIWAVMGSPDFNSQCALGLRESFKRGEIRLPFNEEDADEFLQDLKGYKNLSPEEALRLKLPYINTTLLIGELINLEYETKNNVVKVKEKAGNRKDRYSSLSYNLYVSKQIEREIAITESKKANGTSVFRFRAPILKKKL